MDYTVILKNLSLNNEIKQLVEEKIEEIKEISSSYFITKFIIEKNNKDFFCQIIVIRNDEELKSFSFCAGELSICLESAKNSIIEELLKEIVLSAS